ncbi:hypothetical protein Val02_78550 [Virgisporangium aliadipatigenens]|uniref:Histidine kinase/HSP90-like ATPase domain-containing protein n=1 Tax=Virgisporangium aliadipatigenens TaxID=741659 RepID=A0A8J3YSN3_9ACTN|nr:hypothetical protein Val02_78550 [Virgisporangium aliadipatigenens]
MQQREGPFRDATRFAQPEAVFGAGRAMTGVMPRPTLARSRTPNGGSGLGLAIVAQLVQSSGATISLNDAHGG